MSRFCGEKNIVPIIDAAELWRQECLLERGSIFGLGDVWTDASIDDLVEYFVDNLDTGEGTFFQKLEKQLAPASRDAKVLCAEIMWVMLLPVSNIKPRKKRENIENILTWGGLSLPDLEPILGDKPLAGIGSGGTAYSHLRWKELVYAIRAFKEFFKFTREERVALLEDGHQFAMWLQGIPDNESRQFRHMLLYILFPDNFERIFGASDRIKILKSFGGMQRRDFKSLTAHQIDQKLAELRAQQEESFQTDKLDWYVPPLRALWQNTTKSKDSTEGESIYETLVAFLEQAQTNDLRTRDYPGTHSGLSMRVSFGAGNQAHVPWIGLLAPGQTPTKGIYPVYLYYRADRILILAKGVSATNKPQEMWDTGEGDQSVEQYFQSELGKSAIRYGESYVHAVYDLSEELDKEQVDIDLDSLIEDYLLLVDGEVGEILEPSPKRESESQQHDAEAEKVNMEVLMNDIFISRDSIDNILTLLNNKKNIVLQGPPGVGKSFVAKRIAYAMMGIKDSSRVEMVQFHQSYAYEDFVQGYRPSDSGFELKNGLFHQFCSKASRDPNRSYVFIIDEINRGNLSKIFGEIMLLIEADKRGEDWRVPLTYSKDLAERFYVPENVYLIGLMNTADRSLAMVDYALRRRFAFVDLRPEFKSEGFARFLKEQGADDSMLSTVVSRMTALNDRISKDSVNLGPGFCIGHSFFCAPPDSGIYDNAWYRQVVQFEIGPLVREYWFDDASAAQSIIDELLA